MRNLSILSLVLSFLALTLLSACGFEPMAASHAGQNRAGVRIASVEIDPIPERIGQIFRSELEDLLNPGNAIVVPKLYRLSITLDSSSSQAIVAPDGSVLRYNLILDSHYTLTRIQDNKIIQQGTLKRTGAYNNVPNAYFSTYVSEQDTYKRLAESLAEEYRMRLANILAVEKPLEPAKIP